MKKEKSIELTRLAIIRLCHSALDAHTLRIELSKRLRTIIPFDHFLFTTTDPMTQLFTSVLCNQLPSWAITKLLENEFLQEDFNKFLDLFQKNQAVGVLSEQTQSQLERSQRYREILAPLALGDEMRAIFVTRAACWGTLCLYRARTAPTYTSVEADMLTQLAPHIAEGMRKALLLTDEAAGNVPSGSGVLILAENHSVVAMTLAAEHWLAILTQEDGGESAPLPYVILAVVTRLQAIERGIALDPNLLPKVHVRIASGQWLVISASRLSRIKGPDQITVLFEEAQPAEVASLVMQVYHFTRREGEVTHYILRGWSTFEIAQALHVSSYTVQDHLKAIFEKVNVRSRRELAGTIFAQHLQPPMSTGASLKSI